MPEIIPERDLNTLRYLMEEGYAQTSSIHKDTLSDLSIITTRRNLKELHSQNLIQYYTLPTASGKGSGERVFHITEQGLKTINITKSQIQLHKKCLQRVKGQKLRHYLMMRKVERKICQDISKIYTTKSLNEFNDTKGELCIKAVSNNHPKIQPDARLVIFRNLRERMTILMEMDMGSETIDKTVLGKFKAYTAFLQSNTAFSYAKTFPIHILFISSSARIDNIIYKIKTLKAAKHFLFLPIEKLDEKNLFSDPIFMNYRRKLFSLANLLEKRENLLHFQDTFQKGSRKARALHSLVFILNIPNILTHFFQFYCTQKVKVISGRPDSYLRIHVEQQNQIFEKLFALILDYSFTNDEQVPAKTPLLRNISHAKPI